MFDAWFCIWMYRQIHCFLPNRSSPGICYFFCYWEWADRILNVGMKITTLHKTTEWKRRKTSILNILNCDLTKKSKATLRIYSFVSAYSTIFSLQEVNCLTSMLSKTFCKACVICLWWWITLLSGLLSFVENHNFSLLSISTENR